jgi:hypothetical protein
MSGETEELTDVGSVDSALLWAENPELEYFRVMMNNQMDMEDSLIGDSTLHDLLDGQQLPRPDPPSAIQRSGRHKQRDAEAADTSGLSLNENDTIENIRTIDGSLEAWFAERQVEKAIDAAFEVGTLETPPDIPPRFNPATGSSYPTPQYGPQEGQPAYQQHPFYPAVPPEQNFHPARQYEHADNIVVAPEHVPGFIFVTSGHSSAVQTKAGSKGTTHPLSKSAYYDDSDDDEEDDQQTPNRWGYGRIVLISVLLAVIVAAVIFAVLFSQRSNSLSSSSQAVEAEPPSWAPLPSAPSSTISTSTLTPTSINRKPPAPSEGEPTPRPVDNLSPAPSSASGPTPEGIEGSIPFPPTMRPSKENVATSPPEPSLNVTYAPTMSSVVVRIEALSPESMEALADPTSPQLLALEWLVNDTKADTYSDRQLSQKFVLATLFFSTDGSGWKDSLSWVEDGVDECEWRGIECNEDGGVRAIRLSEDNLSGPLPQEIHLLSDSLEEVFFDENKISGTIPTSVGLLSKLERLQLTENRLEGTLPTELGNLQSIRFLSFKNNDISGTLPTEIGQLNFIRKCTREPSSIYFSSNYTSSHIRQSLLQAISTFHGMLLLETSQKSSEIWIH